MQSFNNENNILNNYLKFKSLESRRFIENNHNPIHHPPLPHLIYQQTFRQTASQTINPPSFQTSSIHPPLLSSLLIPKSIKRNLATKKRRRRRRRRRHTLRCALFSIVNNRCLLGRWWSVIVIKAASLLPTEFKKKVKEDRSMDRRGREGERGQVPFHLMRNSTGRIASRLWGGWEEGRERTLSPISRGEWGEASKATAAALSLCWELSSKPCYLVLP